MQRTSWFIGIGAPRCGTTTLHVALRRHPECWLPPLKELHYWDDQRGRRAFNRRSLGHATHAPRVIRNAIFHRGDTQSGRGDLRFMMRYLSGRRSDSWYRGLFPAGRNVACGEITPAYCTLDTAQIARLDDVLEKPAVLLLLRDPIERAWSACTKQLGRAQDRNIEAATESEIRAALDQIIDASRSDYLGMISRWSGVVGSRLVIGSITEDDAATQAFCAAAAQGLGVDESRLTTNLARTAPQNTTSRFRAAVPAVWEAQLARAFHPMNAQLAETLPLAQRWAVRSEQLL